MRKHLTPLTLVILIAASIAIRNVAPGTYLTGWDNLHPEFDFSLNVKRSLVAVWQEYQGLGLLGGMGHAADLPRQVILWFLSLVIPTNLLRYAWTFAMLGVGALGVYVLAIRVSVTRWAALFGALFYLTNLATVQMFHTPFEAFTTHFGFLPWLIALFLAVLERSSKKNLLLFTIFSIVSTTQGYVQTMFAVYVMILTTIGVTYLIQTRTTTTFKRLVIALSIVFTTNTFWLLPNIYFTATNVAVLPNAKINHMATEEVYLRNQVFGTLTDALLLKGFWFDTFDLDPQRSINAPTLGFWREYAEKPWVQTVLYGWVLLAAIGLWGVVQHKQMNALWLLPVTLLTVTMLTTDTPPFSWLHDWLRTAFPLFHQIFRFPFTKWAIAAGLTFSLLGGVGIARILEYAQKRRTLRVAAFAIPILALAILSYPLFTGNLFYGPMRQQIPREYLDLFSYFRSSPRGRIANLPQPTYWGWSYEAWGYTGSGLLWYGIENPILDRAFDVWSGYNENYYWEISRSIYSKDAQSLASVLNKYDIRYLLVDENLISPSHNRALFTEEIKAMLAALPEVKEVAHFGKLTVYKRLGDDTESFVSLKPNLPTVSPTYNWTDNDVAFEELGDYITDPFTSDVRTSFTSEVYSYPFRSLFTKRSVDEREFTITETPDTLTFGSLMEATSASILKFDALVYDSTRSTDLVAESVKPCGVLREGTATAQNLDQTLRFTSRNQRGCLSFGAGNLPHRDGYLVAVESRWTSGRPLLFSLINQTAKHVELETYLSNGSTHPRGVGNSFTSGVDAWQKDYFVLPPLAPDGLGYTVYLSNDAIGRQETINDVKSIKFYRIPYQKLVSLRSESPHPRGGEIAFTSGVEVQKVDHPNAAYYKVALSGKGEAESATLILSQSFDPGWTAWERVPTAPYLRLLNNHVPVNNWSNGWILKSGQSDQFTNSTNEIVIFFLPQILQWLGFALLPIPFLLGMFWNHRNS